MEKGHVEDRHSTDRTLRNRPNLVLAVAVGAVVVLAIVASIWSATRPATTFDRATPQGTVQAYLQAAIKGDNQEAAGYIAADSPCDIGDLDRNSLGDSPRVVLVDSQTEGTSSRVTVRVVYSGAGGPLDTTEEGEEHTYRLTRSDGRWLITGTPWPLYDCEERVK